MSQPPQNGLFAIERVTATSWGTEAMLRLVDPALRRTSAIPGIAEQVLELLPGIERHRCDSPKSLGIVAEMNDTEAAHLLEHVAMELLAQRGLSRSMRGQTSWEFKRDGFGVYRVHLGCEDVEAVRTALCEASVLLARLTGEAGRC